MIRNIIHGDITSPDNKSDIIIGMNSELQDVTGIGLRFVRNVIPLKVIKLGSVITFDFDEHRKLHMLICHDLGPGGWSRAEMYVRFGLDYLYHVDEEGRQYSIVQIGTGRVGQRDGADHSAIHAAISTSFLPVDLYIFDPRANETVRLDLPTLKPLRAWAYESGEVPLMATA